MVINNSKFRWFLGGISFNHTIPHDFLTNYRLEDYQYHLNPNPRLLKAYTTVWTWTLIHFPLSPFGRPSDLNFIHEIKARDERHQPTEIRDVKYQIKNVKKATTVISSMKWSSGHFPDLKIKEDCFCINLVWTQQVRNNVIPICLCRIKLQFFLFIFFRSFLSLDLFEGKRISEYLW